VSAIGKFIPKSGAECRLDALAGRLAASDLLGILLVLAGAALQRWQGGKSRSRG